MQPRRLDGSEEVLGRSKVFSTACILSEESPPNMSGVPSFKISNKNRSAELVWPWRLGRCSYCQGVNSTGIPGNPTDRGATVHGVAEWDTPEQLSTEHTQVPGRQAFNCFVCLFLSILFPSFLSFLLRYSLFIILN